MSERSDAGAGTRCSWSLLATIGAALFIVFANAWAGLLGLWPAARSMLIVMPAAIGCTVAVLVIVIRSGLCAVARRDGGLGRAVLVFGLAAAAAMLFHVWNVGHDWVCHYVLTAGIARGNLPVRDAAWPMQLLPYHYGFDVLAAALYLPVRGLLHVERVLDAASFLTLLLFLGVARRFLLELGPRAGVSPGSWAAWWAPMLAVFGGGFLWLGPMLAPGQAPWQHGSYGVCHALLVCIGRRPAVFGQALFLLMLVLLLRARDPAHRGWPLRLALAGALAALMLVAEELAAGLALLAAVLLAARDWRPAARFALGAWALALPLVAAQGGLVTAFLAGASSQPHLALAVTEPRLPGWDLDAPTWREALFWMGVLVEIPVTIWLLVATGGRWLRRREPEDRLLAALAALAVLFLLVPLVVRSSYTPNELTRLFLLPQLLSFVLLPCILAAWSVRGPRARMLQLALGVLLTAGPLWAGWAENRRCRDLYGRADWLPDLASSIPERQLQPGRVWLVSTEEFRGLLFGGHFALSAPFGTYGPNYFKIYPEDHAARLARYLEDPRGAGATHGAFNEDDYAVLQARGVSHRMVERVPAFDGRTLTVVSF